LKIVPRKNLRRRLPEPVGEKPAVVADDDFAFRAGDRICAPKIRRRLCDARDVGKVEILRNDRAPAVRAEFDLCHPSSLAQRPLSAKHDVFNPRKGPDRSAEIMSCHPDIQIEGNAFAVPDFLEQLVQ
jgi:hypothetical protein